MQEQAVTRTDYAQAITAGTTPDRQSIIKEYEWAITDLDAALTELFDRLDPVLTPDYPDSVEGVPTPEVSTARYRLHHLQGLTVSVRAITDRLEV